MADEIDDEFPFLQVHRGLAAKAARLAAALGVTYQHARGALDVWWEGYMSRRLLRGITELVLTEEKVAAGLLLAFGKPVDLALMVELTFLESRPGGFKVCGMGRYITAEATRLKKKGGKGTPDAPHPDPLPTPTPPKSGSGVTLEQLWSHPSGTQSDTGVPPGSHPTEERGKRREERGKSEEVMSGAAFFTWCQDRREDLGLLREPLPLPIALNGWFSLAMMEVNGDVDRLQAGWLAYLKDPHWRPKKNPWAGWVDARGQGKKWRELCPAKDVGASKVRACTVCGERLIAGFCGSEEIPLCWKDFGEAQGWCADQRIDMWEQGALARWLESRNVITPEEQRA